MHGLQGKPSDPLGDVPPEHASSGRACEQQDALRINDEHGIRKRREQAPRTVSTERRLPAQIFPVDAPLSDAPARTLTRVWPKWARESCYIPSCGERRTR